jgi:serine/threonine protein kinase
MIIIPLVPNKSTSKLDNSSKRELVKQFNFNLPFLLEYSGVYEGISKTNKDEKVAIKIVKKNSNISDKDGKLLSLIKEDINNLKNIQHPNIIRFFDVYESDDNFYLVMEL